MLCAQTQGEIINDGCAPIDSNYNYYFNENTQKAAQDKMQNAIVLNTHNSTAFVNGKKTLVDANDQSIKPFVESGRVLIPLRFVAEKMGVQC